MTVDNSNSRSLIAWLALIATIVLALGGWLVKSQAALSQTMCERVNKLEQKYDGVETRLTEINVSIAELKTLLRERMRERP